MSKYIRNYNNEGEYNNDSSIPRDSSSVSKVQNLAKYNGVNVVVENENGLVSVGDHVVYDKVDKRKKWVKAGTFNPSNLDSRYVDGKAIFICNYNGKPFVFGVESLGSPVWAEYGRFVLKDFDLENGGTANLTVQNSGGGTSLSFTWAAGATMSDVLNAYKAASTALGGYYNTYSSSTLSGNQINLKAWYAPTAATGCTLVVSKCVDVNGNDVIFNPSYGTLATITNGELSEIGYNAMNMMGKDAGIVFGTKQYAVYMATSGGTTYGDETAQFMNKATFDALADNPETDTYGLYAKYGGDYTKYAAVCAELRRTNPDVKFKCTKTSRDGKRATEVLAKVKLYDFNGSLINAFPAMANSHNYGITTQGVVTGFEAGNWHLLGVGEMLKLLHKVRRVNTDPIDDINKAITEANGTLINQNTSYALCGAYTANYQLLVYGTNGGYGSDARIGGYVARVALAFEYNH